MSESMKQINDRLVQDNVDLKCEAEGKGVRIVELEAKVEHDEDNLEGLQHALVRANQEARRCEGCGNEAPNKNHAMCVGTVLLCNRWAEKITP